MQDFVRVLTTWIASATSISNEEHALYAVQIATEDTVLGVKDGFVLVDTTSGSVTITLPDHEQVEGQTYTIKRSTGGPNWVRITAAMGQIEDANSMYLWSQYSSMTFKCNGHGFWLIASVVGNAMQIAPGSGVLRVLGQNVIPISNQIRPFSGSLTLTGGNSAVM
jgi:hypothetical protein